MIANSGNILRAWQQRVASRCFEHRTERRAQMPDDERFLGSVRRECLDHYLIFQEKQLHHLLKAYVVYFNQARPHQGLGQRIPDPLLPFAPLPNEPNKVIAVPVLGGLHHDYRTAA
jgi:putative transposase